MRLYHRDVFWKPKFDRLAYKLITKDIVCSEHLLKHFKNKDKKHNIDYDKFVEIVNNLYYRDNEKFNKHTEVFEVEENSHIITKAVFRCPYDNKYDICIVIRYGRVVTAWLSDIFDNHRTLDNKKYFKK